MTGDAATMKIGFGGRVVHGSHGKFTFKILAEIDGECFEVVPPLSGWPEFNNMDAALNKLRALIPKFLSGKTGEYSIVPFFESQSKGPL